jgi:hypothetical protein
MDNRPLKIYSRENTPRLRYISGIILTDILGLSIEITNDKRKLGKHHVINYSSENIKDSLKISPDTLLFEKGVISRELSISQWKGLPVFFSSSEDSDLPFDIFAASFYLVSRYEEYLDFQPDQYGRFSASSSIAFKNGFLQTAVVDKWTKELAKVMLKKFVTLTFKRNEFNALLTIDADQLFMVRRRNLIRTLGDLLREFQSKESSGNEALENIQGNQNDPYSAFYYLSDTLQNNTDVRIFFSVGDHSRYGKKQSWKNNDYRRLIQNISEKYKTGLNQSYFASESLPVLNKEVFRLKEILGREVNSGRFHFIRLQIPESYNNMIEAGITEDYSMGYPDTPGFRAGIARPFYFYDLAGDKQTSLKIIPFEFCDETLVDNPDIKASKELILLLINETRKAGGYFVSYWHNSLLHDNRDWQIFREVFEFMLINQIP